MTRVLSGVAIAAVALVLIVFAPSLVLRLVACGVAWLASREYLRLVGGHHACAAVAALGCWFVSAGTSSGLAVAVMLSVGVAAWRVLAAHEAPAQAAAGAFATPYIGAPLGWLVAVHVGHGWPATVLLVATVVVSDSAQYYSGRLFGRRPLAPAISPKKTVEGALGGLVLGTGFTALAGTAALPSAAAWHLPLLGAAAVALGICGDLFESQMKRLVHVKDSGSLIPGHGGVLDRIDALLFVIPVFGLYLGSGR